MNKYQLVEQIGDGTYGSVWKAFDNSTGEKVAIKKLKHKIPTWNDCMELNEVKVLSKIKDHKNIIKLKEVTRDNNSNVFLIFEYCDINLFEYMEKTRRNGKTINESKAKSIVYQVAKGLDHLHSNLYVHRDLKPENILLLNPDSQSDLVVKIADFGIAREVNRPENSIFTYINPDTKNTKRKPMTDYVCTRWYRAPECVLKSTNYNQAVDIFALGAIFAELLTGKPLFPGESEFDQLNKIVSVLGAPNLSTWPEGHKLISLLNMKFPSLYAKGLKGIVYNLSDEGLAIMEKMLQWDPNHRIPIRQIIQSSYFSGFKTPGANILFSGNPNANTNGQNIYSKAGMTNLIYPTNTIYSNLYVKGNPYDNNEHYINSNNKFKPSYGFLNNNKNEIISSSNVPHNADNFTRLGNNIDYMNGYDKHVMEKHANDKYIESLSKYADHAERELLQFGKNRANHHNYGKYIFNDKSAKMHHMYHPILPSTSSMTTRRIKYY